MSFDPRDDVDFTIEAGQVYSDARTDEHVELIYADANVCLLQDRETNHRLTKRKSFEREVGSGRYTRKIDVESFAETALPDDCESVESIEFEELDGIGAKAASNLRAAGFETNHDVMKASDDELLDISWVGETGLDSIRQAVQ
jgi:DNA-directed RNA polymerase alpha subunit